MMQKPHRRSLWEQGAAGLEGAIAIPLTLLMLAFMLWGSYVAVTRIASVLGVAEQSRVLGGASSAASNALDITPLGTTLNGAVSSGASGCERNVVAVLGTTRTVDVPLFGLWTIGFAGSSTSRVWDFQPGPSSDGCP